MPEVNLQTAILESKKIIEKKKAKLYNFDEYTTTYIATTENIAGYLNRVGYNKNDVLTVLSSGDHVFNLIHKGINRIDAFDINKLTYYIYHLKRTMIKELPYESFLRGIKQFTDIETLEEIIKKLKPYIPEDVYEYYRKILEYATKSKTGLKPLYYQIMECFLNVGNNYLQSEEAYLQCRKNMGSTEVNLHFNDVRAIPSSLTHNYDLILLSNITDYLGSPLYRLTLNDFNELMSLFYELLKKDGALINYFFGNASKYLIANSLITKCDLIEGSLTFFSLRETMSFFDEGYYLIRKK